MSSSATLTLSGQEISFLEHPDALIAPRRAMMDAGYTRSYAEHNSSKMLQKHLPTLVEKARARLEKLAITPDWVRNEVMILARTAPSDFIEFVEDLRGNQMAVLKKRTDIPDDKWRAAVKEMEFMDAIDAQGNLRSRVEKIKFYDRQKAIMDLANLLGMTNEKVLLLQAGHAAKQLTDQDKLLEQMTTSELEEIARIQENVAARIRGKASARRDAEAIKGEKE